MSTTAATSPLTAADNPRRQLRQLAVLGPARQVTVPMVVVVGFLSVCATGAAATQGLLAGFVVILGTAVAFAVLKYPALGAFILVAGVPVLSGMKRGVPVPGLRASEALVIFGALAVLVPAHRRETPKWGTVDWLGFVYAVGSIAIPAGHLVARGEQLTVGNLGSMFLPLQFFLLYRTVRTALATETQRRLALQLLLYSSVLVSFIAAVQQLDIGPARDIVGRITASEALDSYSYAVYARATGPFQHWHPLAGYLTVVILLCVGLLLDNNQRVMGRRPLFVVLAASLAALMLSVTFVSMFGVLAGSALLGAWYGGFRRVLKWSVVGALIAMTLFGSYVTTRLHNQYTDRGGVARQSLVPQTIQKRLDVWQDEYMPAMQGRWVSGYGPDLPPDVRWTHTESVYVTLLMRGGIPLMTVFVAVMLAVSASAKDAAKDIVRRAEARTLAALVAVLWVMQMLYPYFTSSGLPQPFWVLAGIAFAGWQTGVIADRSSDRLKSAHNGAELS